MISSSSRARSSVRENLPLRAIASLFAASLAFPAATLAKPIDPTATLAQRAQGEYNPAHHANVPEPADRARVIVKFKPSAAIVQKHALATKASAADAQAVATARADALGFRLATRLSAGRALDERTQVVHGSGMSSDELATRLAAEDDVEYAVPDRRKFHTAVPNDPLYTQGPAISGTTGGPASGQWYLRAPAGEVVSGINAPAAWELTTGDPNVVVAVLDTGVRPEHPDLAGKLLPGYDMIRDVDAANDGDARDSDATDPGDWVTAAESNDAEGPFHQCGTRNSSWHGTMTSSLIGAATNNGAGMAGVAWNVKVLPVRVLAKCGGYDSDIAAGIRWAAGLSVPGIPANPTPARVINLSLGASGACSPAYIDAAIAVQAKANPAVLIAAAGNSAGHEVGTPANCPGYLGVAALRHVGTKVGFSDLGPQVAISAPGGNCVNTAAGQPCLYPILAATNAGTTEPGASIYTNSFKRSVGTSFSAPLVAGVAALMLSVNPSLTPAQLKAAMQASARPFPTNVVTDGEPVPACVAPSNDDQIECACTTTTCGAGMLDAAAAVAAVKPLPNVIEFYNGLLDHYFITADAGEASAIDSGSAGPGWSRTGNTFKSGGSAQVCRFFGSITPGPNSHFYTIDANECTRLKQLQALASPAEKRWNFESLDFASSPTASGGCAAGKTPVRRAYNNGFLRGIDSNHRITTNATAIQDVVARGWIDEGIVMCAP